MIYVYVIHFGWCKMISLQIKFKKWNQVERMLKRWGKNKKGKRIFIYQPFNVCIAFGLLLLGFTAPWHRHWAGKRSASEERDVI